MKQLTLNEQEKLFIDSYIASFTKKDLWQWMNVETNINVKNGMVKDALAEEEESKNVLRSTTDNEDDDGENDVAAHIPSPSADIAMLSEADQMCYKCDVSIAASSLRRAKREIELKQSVRRGGKTHQLLLKEMLRIRK